jgi:predicted DNA-binding protein with PD1-like motif
MEGSVYPTAEIVITELPAKMRRILDEKTGLSLLHTE